MFLLLKEGMDLIDIMVMDKFVIVYKYCVWFVCDSNF